MVGTNVLRLSDYANPGLDFHHHLVTAGAPSSPHAHDFFEIMAVLSGSMHVETDGQSCVLVENDVIITRPKESQRFGSDDGNPCRFLNLAFSTDLFLKMRNYLGETEQWDLLMQSPSPPVCHAKLLYMQRLQQRMTDISMLAPDNLIHHRQRFRLLLAELFMECFLNPSEESSTPAWLHHVLDEMTKLDNLRIGLPAIHQLSGMHPDSVSRAFRRCLNTTPTAWLQESRLSWLANQLAHSDEEIIALALDVGFENLSHCYHLFKRRFGCAPGAWRKRYHAPLH